MADRRMFSKKVIESGRMLKLSPRAQLLYIHMGMNADDDGIVEAYAILSLVKATESDLQSLQEKGFIRILNDDLVCFILDWKENNQLRSDRIQPSIYRNLLLESMPETELQTVKERADTKKKRTSKKASDGECVDDKRTSDGRPLDDQTATNGQPADDKRSTNGRQMDTIGKDSIGKEKVLTPLTGSSYQRETPSLDVHRENSFSPPSLDEVKAYFRTNLLKGDPEKFFYTYQPRGWVDGAGIPVRDWHGKAVFWSLNEKNSNGSSQEKPDGRPRDYDGSYDGHSMKEVSL